MRKIHKAQALNSDFWGSCLLVVLFCSLSACATSGDVTLMNQDINKLQRDFQMMKNELNILEEKTTGVAKEESFNVVRQNQAEVQSRLSALSRDLQVLSGRFDENKYFNEKTLKSSASEMDIVKLQITTMEGQIKEIKDRVNALETQMRQQKEPSKEQATESYNDTEDAGKESQAHGGQTAKPAATPDKLAKYDSAYSAFKSRKFKDARKKFEAFIKEYPQDELTDNAYFWIAETYYGEKDYEAAILAYETFLKKYPKSEKAPSGFLKQGLAFNGIGDKKTGKVILEQVMERYPDSKEAEIAKKTLKGLEKKTSVKKKK